MNSEFLTITESKLKQGEIIVKAPLHYTIL